MTEELWVCLKLALPPCCNISGGDQEKLVIDWLIGHFVFSFTPHFLYLRCVFPHLSCSRSDLEIMTTGLYLSFRMVTQKAPATSMQGEGQEKKERLWKKKSIGFHYLVGQCHWRVSDPATLLAHSIATDKRKACWLCAGTSQNTDLHFKSVKGHHTPRGHAQGARRSMGWGGSGHWIRFFEVGVGGRMWSGFHTLHPPPPPPPWLSDCLTSLH